MFINLILGALHVLVFGDLFISINVLLCYRILNNTTESTEHHSLLDPML